MPSVCSVCLKGLTRRERENPDGKCRRHTKNRIHRVKPQQLISFSPALRYGNLPLKIRQEYPALACTFNDCDKHGGGQISCLACRPDCRV
eukprot:314365-Pyramimonas_sp.AAC.1